jgi:hypothetical protein
MSQPLDLRLVDADLEDEIEARLSAGPSETPPGPSVFARAVPAPAGWPWEQVRGAELAARHEAPLPMDQMYLRLKRLTPWRPTQAALFAACYVRVAEIQERFEAQVEVEGRPVQVVFEPPQALARRARRSLAAGLAAAAVAALLFVSIAGALLARAEGEEQLAAMERDATVKLQRAEAAQLIRRQSAALTAASPGDRMAAPLADLAWAMAVRAPEARIEAWRWEAGVSRVEARGEVSPFADPGRAVSREGATSGGGSLWRIEPQGSAR